MRVATRTDCTTDQIVERVVAVTGAAYFTALAAEMLGSGPSALLNLLQRYDYSATELRKIPQTTALMENKLMSSDPLVRWRAGAMEAGSQLRDGGEWLGEMLVRDLFTNFQLCVQESRRFSSANELPASSCAGSVRDSLNTTSGCGAASPDGITDSRLFNNALKTLELSLE